ncbi:MAG: type II toxin-antitoxin system RelE/ParE family toxin [Gammaproteobacteria bacterium]|nr:type II toxin-antitoxin system RelE/ParE family toxin [Gammaproteobacteria bacterium]
MIRSFRHKGLEAFFLHGSRAGIPPRHAARLRLILTALDCARRPADMNASGWRMHALHGRLSGFHAVRVSANWRVIFRFEAGNAQDVDYLDYH